VLLSERAGGPAEARAGPPAAGRRPAPLLLASATTAGAGRGRGSGSSQNHNPTNVAAAMRAEKKLSRQAGSRRGRRTARPAASSQVGKPGAWATPRLWAARTNSPASVPATVGASVRV